MNEYQVRILLNARDNASRALGKVDRNLRMVRKQARGTSSAVKGLGGSFKGALTSISPFTIGAAGAVAILARGVGQAREFSKGIAEVRTILPQGGKEFANLSDMVRDFADEVGIASNDAVPALYQAISATVPPENVFDFLQVANQVAVGGVTDLETAVDALTTATNAFGAQGLTATQASDALFTAVRLGKTTIEELSRSIGQVSPLAAAAGVSFEELNVHIAQLTTGGFATSEAATAVRSAIDGLLKPSNDLNDIWRAAGFESGQAAIKALGLAGAMDIVAQAADGDLGALKALVGSTEAVSSILAATGDNADSFNEKLVQMEDNAGATGKAFDIVAESDAFKLEQSLNRLNNLTERLGADLLPSVAGALEVFATAVSSTANSVQEDSKRIDEALSSAIADAILAPTEESGWRNAWREWRDTVLLGLKAVETYREATTSADETTERWGDTLRQINSEIEAQPPAIRRIVDADDALVDVEISLLEVQQTRIKILASLTAQTAAYNKQQRVQADNLAAVARATGTAESANGSYELSIVRINRAGREQAARLKENAARFVDYEAAVADGDAVTAGHERTLENYGRTAFKVTEVLGGGGGGGGGLTQAEKDAEEALRFYNKTLVEGGTIVNSWALKGEFATTTFEALTELGIVPALTEAERLTEIIRFLGVEQGLTEDAVASATSTILAQRDAFEADTKAAKALKRSLEDAKRAQDRLTGARSGARASTAAGAVSERIDEAVERGDLSEFDAAVIRVNTRDALAGLSAQEQRDVFEGTSDQILFGRTPDSEAGSSISDLTRQVFGAGGNAPGFTGNPSEADQARLLAALPSLAEGGIVRRPTLAVVGDRSDGRPEVISALPRDGSIGGGMTVNIQGDVYAQDGYAFGDKVTEALRRRGLVAVA